MINHDIIRWVDLIKSDIVLICIVQSNREMQIYCILLDKNAVFMQCIHPYEELSDISQIIIMINLEVIALLCHFWSAMSIFNVKISLDNS